MKRFFALAALAGLLIGCGAQGAGAQDSPPSASEFSQAERDEIRDMVRAYILENPEIIEEALIELQRRAIAREREEQAAAIAVFAEAIYEDDRDPRLGPDDADIVIVEFMDYRCSYCRAASQWVRSVRETYGDRVQFVFKEYPILGEQSEEASRAALAALEQGDDVYEAFHMALVGASGGLPSDRIDQLAALSGVDVEAMRQRMDDSDISNQIRTVRQLGQSLGVSGTPFFIVDGQVVRGANQLQLDQALARALDG